MMEIANVDKEIIRSRKETYGDNFPKISKLWSEFLGIHVAEPEVAEMMALMKAARIDAIEKALDNVLRNDQDEDAIINYAKFATALKDSETDRDNYLWIADNYIQYKVM